VNSDEKETAQGAPAQLRSDAQRNRDNVLAAAVLAFAQDANASLEGIARTAGVGIGTLYRHYPTREALVEAAYRNEIKKLCDEAPELLARHRPDIALGRFLDRFVDHMQTKPGMIEALRAMIAAGNATPLNQSLGMIAAAVAPILEAGRAEHVLRDDVSVDDFIAVKGAVATARPEQARRLATLLIDGLRHGAHAPKPANSAKNAKKTKAKKAARTRR
jgi:AcrR family transcriptional regulator